MPPAWENVGSTGQGILIGVFSALGSAAMALMALALFFFFRHTRRGRIILDFIGSPGAYDDEEAFQREEEAALEVMDDMSKVEYLRAKAFIQANPPETLRTDISLSQYLAIQEKGVAAWEFQPEIETANCFVESRTEIEFFDSDCSVQSNLPVPKQNDVYYWEAKIFDKPETSLVSIGMSTKPYPLFRLPGYHKSSVAYFSNGDRRYNQPFRPTPHYGPRYMQGDVIGVGYRPRSGTVFFTRNGKKLDDVVSGVRAPNFFPTVGATGPCSVHVNLGQLGFVYIEANVKKWGLAPVTGTLAPPPPYGSEQGSILLETGTELSPEEFVNQESARERSASASPSQAATSYTRTRGRSGTGLLGIGGPTPPRGPTRNPTDISLAQLSRITSSDEGSNDRDHHVDQEQESRLLDDENAKDANSRPHRSDHTVVNIETSNSTAPPFTNSPPPEYSSPAGSISGSPPIPSYEFATRQTPDPHHED